MVHNTKINRIFVDRLAKMARKRLIIFTHGIAEGPQVFRDLMQYCQSQGYDTKAITLPGHGGSCREFSKTNGDLWLKHLQEMITDSESEYSDIILVGHSLGSLLSILASDTSDKIRGLILINAPLSVRVLPRAVTNNLKIGLGFSIKPGDKAWAASQAISVGKGRPWEYIGWIPRIRDLFRYIRQSLLKLPSLDMPMLAIHSDKDELVGPKTVTLYRDLVSKDNIQILRLHDSTHFEGPKTDRDIARQAISEALNRMVARM